MLMEVLTLSMKLSEFAVVFIDDILIFSKSADEHKRHIEIVLPELRKHKILLKPSKCVWAQTKLPYLGHIIGRNGIKPDPKKVQSVVDWPTPTCLREVLQFLGLTNFFIKFIQGYANLTKPMTDLSKKNVPFDWTPSRDSTFKALKHLSHLLLSWLFLTLINHLSCCVMPQALV